MLKASKEPRLVIENSDWLTMGTAETDIDCPASGKRVAARYPNGDSVRVEFLEVESAGDFGRRYLRQPLPTRAAAGSPPGWEPPGSVTAPPSAKLTQIGAVFPLTVVEVEMRVPGLHIDFGPRDTELATNVFAGERWTVGGRVGFQLG
jgi:hypothetical protein